MNKINLIRIGEWVINLDKVSHLRHNNFIEGCWLYLDDGNVISLNGKERDLLLKRFKIEEIK